MTLQVVPKTGKVLLFYHKEKHFGELMGKGVKYIARSDLLFTASK